MDGEPEGSNGNAVGVIGPRSAPDWMCDALAAGARCDVAASIFTFKMFDDDGELYYTGRMMTDCEDDEDAAYAPLGDYGTPNAGATSITYPGHPELDC